MTKLQRVQYKQFSKEYFDNGVWGRMRRIALSQEGNVVGVHDPNNTDMWEDGTSVNWVEYENEGWNCMVQIPKFYYRTISGTYLDFEQVYRLEVSSTPREGFKIHPAFEREQGVVENYQYMSAFRGWLDGLGRLRSLPGKNMTNNITVVQSRQAALSNGTSEHYSQQDYYLTNAVQMLLFSELGSWNARGKIGAGGSQRVTGVSVQHGNNTFGSGAFITYRGIEHFYGNHYVWVDGFNIRNYEVFLAKNNFKSDKITDNYVKVESATLPTAGNNAVADIHRLIGEYDWTMFPSESTGANIDNHLASYYTSNSGDRVAAFGGSHSSNSGAASWDLDRASGISHASYGCRLQYLVS